MKCVAAASPAGIMLSMKLGNQRTPIRLMILLLVVALANVANTCVVVEEGGEEPAYRDESAEGQMQEEEVDELDRETGW